MRDGLLQVFAFLCDSVVKSPPPFLKPHLVIRRGAVSSWHGLLVQPQIHAELRAMMHHMIQKHFPESQKSRSLKNVLALNAQLPAFVKAFIRTLSHPVSNLARTFIAYLH